MDSELDFDVDSFLYDKNRNSSSSVSSFKNMFVYRNVQNVMEHGRQDSCFSHQAGRSELEPLHSTSPIAACPEHQQQHISQAHPNRQQTQPPKQRSLPLGEFSQHAFRPRAPLRFHPASRGSAQIRHPSPPWPRVGKQRAMHS